MGRKRQTRAIFGSPFFLWEIELAPSTKELHQTLIRLIKGCVSAWERWLQQQK